MTVNTQDKRSKAETAPATQPSTELIQPWKQFITVKETEHAKFVDGNNCIRIVDGRVDGKKLGG
jgi:hypothetical protein